MQKSLHIDEESIRMFEQRIEHGRDTPSYGMLLVLYHKLLNGKELTNDEVLEGLWGLGSKFLGMAGSAQRDYFESIHTAIRARRPLPSHPMEAEMIYHTLHLLIERHQVSSRIFFALVPEEEIASMVLFIHTPHQPTRSLMIAVWESICRLYSFENDTIPASTPWGAQKTLFSYQRDYQGVPPLLGWLRHMFEAGTFLSRLFAEDPFRYYELHVLPSMLALGQQFHARLVLQCCEIDHRYILATFSHYARREITHSSHSRALMIRTLSEILGIIVRGHMLAPGSMLSLDDVDTLLVQMLCTWIPQDHVLLQRALGHVLSNTNFLYYLSKRPKALIQGLFEAIYQNTRTTNPNCIDLFGGTYFRLLSDMLWIDKQTVSRCIVAFNSRAERLASEADALTKRLSTSL